MRILPIFVFILIVWVIVSVILALKTIFHWFNLAFAERDRANAEAARADRAEAELTRLRLNERRTP